MTEPGRTAIADALHREWGSERLSPEARARIEQQLATPPRSSARWRPLVVLAAGLLAAALIASGLLSGESGTSDARARAVAALDPGARVLHYRAVVTQSGADRPVRVEEWIYPDERRSHRVVRDPSGALQLEILSSPGGIRIWSPRSGWERLAPQSRDQPQEPRQPYTATSLDQVREVLPRGRVSGPRNDSRTGRDVYEIVAIERDPLATWRVRYLADAATFAPVRLEREVVRTSPRMIAPRPGDVVTMEFDLVERVSPHAAARALREPARRR